MIKKKTNVGNNQKKKDKLQFRMTNTRNLVMLKKKTHVGNNQKKRQIVVQNKKKKLV